MNFKSGFVNLVGRPNVGKSTLLNVLAGEKVAITSNKPQTTRNLIRAIVTDGESQVVFIDTPGIHRPRTMLGEYMVNVAVGSISDVDIVLFITDASDRRSKDEDLHIIESLKKTKSKVILIINKIDLVQKNDLLPFIKFYSEQMDFHAIIPVSSVKNDGIDVLVKVIKSVLPEGPKYFPDDTLTDQPERVIVAEIIREKMLHNLSDEVPHGIGVEVLSFKDRDSKEIIDIQVNVICEKDSHKAIIIGKNGQMLKKIGMNARRELERFLGTKVFLEIWVKVREDWRNNTNMLKNLGYRNQ